MLEAGPDNARDVRKHQRQQRVGARLVELLEVLRAPVGVGRQQVARRRDEGDETEQCRESSRLPLGCGRERVALSREHSDRYSAGSRRAAWRNRQTAPVAPRRLPVLVLTARGSWSEKVEGIDASADDYLAKPFRMEELLARLRSVIRRSAGHASSLATVGGLTLDERAMRVRLNGIPVDLSPMEYRLILSNAAARTRRVAARIDRKHLRRR